jgi:hypothetical protein
MGGKIGVKKQRFLEKKSFRKAARRTYVAEAKQDAASYRSSRRAWWEQAREVKVRSPFDWFCMGYHFRIVLHSSDVEAAYEVHKRREHTRLRKAIDAVVAMNGGKMIKRDTIAKIRRDLQRPFALSDFVDDD